MNLAMPEVQEGEIYAGILIKGGVPSHHLILLPGEAYAKAVRRVPIVYEDTKPKHMAPGDWIKWAAVNAQSRLVH